MSPTRHFGGVQVQLWYDERSKLGESSGRSAHVCETSSAIHNHVKVRNFSIFFLKGTMRPLFIFLICLGILTAIGAGGWGVYAALSKKDDAPAPPAPPAPAPAPPAPAPPAPPAPAQAAPAPPAPAPRATAPPAPAPPAPAPLRQHHRHHLRQHLRHLRQHHRHHRHLHQHQRHRHQRHLHQRQRHLHQRHRHQRQHHRHLHQHHLRQRHLRQHLLHLRQRLPRQLAAGERFSVFRWLLFQTTQPRKRCRYFTAVEPFRSARTGI